MSASLISEAYRLIESSVQLNLFINNTFVAPVLNGRMELINPSDESVITTQVPAATTEDVDLAVSAAKNAFETWGKTTGA